MRRHSELRDASELIAAAISRPEVMRRLHAQQVFRHWSECVGDLLASKSAPERFEGGTLWVAAKGAAWVQELQMRKAEILVRLNEIAGGNLFTEIRFGVRPLPKAAAEEHSNAEPIGEVAVDVTFAHQELEPVARRALARLRAASRKPRK
jgi:predicted nucleic acid-binding Zn ribbon protein